MKCETHEEGIRGVTGHHNRVYPANQAEFDRLADNEGERAPWHGDHPPDPPPSRTLFFLHSLIHVGTARREIFFARLQGFSWAEIGDTVLKGATKQAAQNEWRDMMRQFPDLKYVFQVIDDTAAEANNEPKTKPRKTT